MIKFEIIFYLILALLLSSFRRIISGMKNGCFYAKGNAYEVPRLKKYIGNIHYLETPAWYTQFGSVYFFVFAILRLIQTDNDIPYIQEFIGAMLITMGSSGMASYHFQGYINLGSDKPFIYDENYHPEHSGKSEFAWGKIDFWWTRPWTGKRRLYLIPIGAISIILGIYIGMFL